MDFDIKSNETKCHLLLKIHYIIYIHVVIDLFRVETIQLEVNRLEDRVEDGICNLRKERLVVFEVDCPIEIESATGIEIFGVVCQVPECCTKCVLQ